MKRKDAFALLYIIGGVIVAIGIGIAILGFIQDRGWIQKLVEISDLSLPGLILVIAGTLLSSWARRQVNKRN